MFQLAAGYTKIRTISVHDTVLMVTLINAIVDKVMVKLKHSQLCQLIHGKADLNWTALFEQCLFKTDFITFINILMHSIIGLSNILDIVVHIHHLDCFVFQEVCNTFPV